MCENGKGTGFQPADGGARRNEMDMNTPGILKEAENMISYQVNINGIEVSASYSRRAAEEIFLPLLRRLSALQRERGRRILVMLAAPPGAGKSTLLSFLQVKYYARTLECAAFLCPCRRSVCYIV